LIPASVESEVKRPDRNDVLWDVVEEHLAESDFLLEQIGRAFDSPTLTLTGLEQGLEARFSAHLDALAVGGDAVYDGLLKPVLDEPDPEQPGRVASAALIAIERRRFGDLKPALAHEAAAVRAAAVDACALSSGSSKAVEDWLHARWRDVTDARERASLLGVIARIGLEPPPLIEWLQGEDPLLAGAAAFAARHADPRRHLAVIEYLLDHQDVGVREAAMISALAWRSHRGSLVCEALALDASTPRPLSMALCASLGGQRQHDALAQKVSVPAHRPAALFALGFSGNPAMLPLLLDRLADPAPQVAKIAAQAVATIVGIDLQDSAFIADEPEPPSDPDANLPPLEKDDLDADLAPAPEDALPRPNAQAIRRFCEQQRAAWSPGQRYLAGRDAKRETLFECLEREPLRRRHVLALALAIQGGGTGWVDTRTFAREQRRRLGMARQAGTR
jgi:uncharacterized protein (TIGR02270 family)